MAKSTFIRLCSPRLILPLLPIQVFRGHAKDFTLIAVLLRDSLGHLAGSRGFCKGRKVFAAITQTRVYVLRMKK